MIYESIIPGLNLMAIGMLIVFTFLLILIISTKLMTLILSIGNIENPIEEGDTIRAEVDRSKKIFKQNR